MDIDEHVMTTRTYALSANELEDAVRQYVVRKVVFDDDPGQSAEILAGRVRFNESGGGAELVAEHVNAREVAPAQPYPGLGRDGRSEQRLRPLVGEIESCDEEDARDIGDEQAVRRAIPDSSARLIRRDAAGKRLS